MSDTVARGRSASVPTIGSLTSLRYIAAVGVVMLHTRGTFLPTGFLRTYPLANGVNFFFVLSGFILTYVHRDGLVRMDATPFYAARFARIWPGAVASAVLIVLVAPMGAVFPLWTPGSNIVNGTPVLLSNLTMTQAWVPLPTYYFSLNPVAWSISVEIAFYLAFPLLIRSLRTTWWWKLALVMGLGFLLVWFSYAAHLPTVPGPSDLYHPTTPGVVLYHPLSRAKEFLIGMIGAVWLMNAAPRPLGRTVWTMAELNFLALTIAAGLYVPRLRVTLLGIRSANLGIFVDQTLLAAVYCCTICVFAFNRGALSSALSTRLPVRLGEASFALYLVHYPVFLWTTTHQWIWKPLPMGLRFPLFLGAISSLAYLWWRLAEVPLRDSLRRRLTAWLASAPGARIPRLRLPSRTRAIAIPTIYRDQQKPSYLAWGTALQLAPASAAAGHDAAAD